MQTRLTFFFFQAEDGIRDTSVTGVQTCALPIFDMSAKPHVPRLTGRVPPSVNPNQYPLSSINLNHSSSTKINIACSESLTTLTEPKPGCHTFRNPHAAGQHRRSDFSDRVRNRTHTFWPSSNIDDPISVTTPYIHHSAHPNRTQTDTLTKHCRPRYPYMLRLSVPLQTPAAFQVWRQESLRKRIDEMRIVTQTDRL